LFYLVTGGEALDMNGRGTKETTMKYLTALCAAALTLSIAGSALAGPIHVLLGGHHHHHHWHHHHHHHM
jgi:hypothetical protein